MHRNHRIKAVVLGVTAALGLTSGTSYANDSLDFGAAVEKALHNKSHKLFGFTKPLAASAPATVGAYRTATQATADQALVHRYGSNQQPR